MGNKPGVIKAGSSIPRWPAELKSFQLNDVIHEARQMVTIARVDAEKIVNEARARADEIQKSAQNDGYRAGYDLGIKEGRQAGRAEAFEAARQEFDQKQKSLIKSCQETIAGINADRAAWKDSAYRDLIELAMAIARRVAHHVGQRERKVVLANLQEAVRLAGTRSDVTIMVNPDDGETARLFAKSLVDLRAQVEHVRVLEAPEISPGGCQVQWGTGMVDATLDTQLDRISSELVKNEDNVRGEG